LARISGPPESCGTNIESSLNSFCFPADSGFVFVRSKEASMAISVSASLLDSSVTSSLTAGQASPPKSTTANNGSTTNGGAYGSSPDLLTQDIINLLKALAYGDVSGAKSDLAKFKTDLKAEAGNAISLNNVAKDVTSLFKDLTSGNSTAAKTDLNKINTDLQAQEASTAPGNLAFSSLESLVIKISDALSAGAVQSAVRDVAGYLVQHGQASGSLINISA
jgi:hypothetical protein